MKGDRWTNGPRVIKKKNIAVVYEIPASESPILTRGSSPPTVRKTISKPGFEGLCLCDSDAFSLRVVFSKSFH